MNQLLSALTDRPTIKSGESVTVTVTCTVENGGTMFITPTNGFEIDPDRRTLASGQTRDEFDLRIERKAATTANCDLRFDFRGSRQPATVTVTGKAAGPKA